MHAIFIETLFGLIKALFLTGLFNRNIQWYLSQKNPRTIVENNFQIFSLNVWCGILSDRLIGTFFIERTIVSRKILSIINWTYLQFGSATACWTKSSLFSTRHRCPHNARINMDWLNSTFGGIWIGKNGAVRWPASSPNITFLDF